MMCEDRSPSALVSHSDDVEINDIDEAEDMSFQWLIGTETDTDCYMRRYTIGPGGRMVLHKHNNIYHMQYVLRGRLRVTIGREEHEVERGSFLIIPEGTPHSYEKIGSEEAQFLCMIPAVEEMDVDILE